MPYASRICSNFPLWMESKALVKSTNINVACRFFARTPSRILRMVNICEVVDGNYTRMLRAILNKSWQQHPTRHQLYGHLPPITKIIQVRRTRHAGYCWRSRDELIRDVLLWIPTHGRAKAGRPARTYIQQRCEDTGCSPEDLPRAMNDREEWRERVRDINATSVIWWRWWYIYLTGLMKHSLFQAAVVSILLYGCTTWTLTKRMEKKLDGNYTRMVRAILNKSWRHDPTKQQLYGHLPPIHNNYQS